MTSSTRNPSGEFVAQQARNLSMDGETEWVAFLIRDRDSKYTRAFDEVFISEGARVIKTPVRTPVAAGRTQVVTVEDTELKTGLARQAYFGGNGLRLDESPLTSAYTFQREVPRRLLSRPSCVRRRFLVRLHEHSTIMPRPSSWRRESG
jgi:hypothetical protein